MEVYFKEFIRFFFPNIAADVNWSRRYIFLDKELQQVAREAALGRKYVDKLVRLHRTNGYEEWVLVHIEVQSQRDIDFSRRMYTYTYRIFDRFDRKVASLAILADENPAWRPDHYRDSGVGGGKTVGQGSIGVV